MKTSALRTFWVFAFGAAAVLHLAGIFQPFLGNFAQHQTDYATVVQRWVETSIRPLDPVMRFIALGKNRLFYGDFPLNITVTAVIVKSTGLPIEAAGRGLSAIFFFLSILPFAGSLKLAFKNQNISRWAVLFYSLSPLTLIYGQSFLLEMTALAWGIAGYYFFLKWFYKKSDAGIYWAGLLFSIMLVTRIYFAPAVLPAAFLVFRRAPSKGTGLLGAAVFLSFCLALPAAWQIYAGMMAGQRGDESSLLDNLRVFVTADPTTPRHSMNLKMILPVLDTFVAKLVTPAGFILVFMAVLVRDQNSRAAVRFCVFALGCFIPLLMAAPRKFVEFDYYFLPLVPFCAVLAAAAMNSLISRFDINKARQAVFIALVFGLALRYSAGPIWIVPDEDRSVLETAARVRKIAPADARVIASHGSSTSFLYYTGRDGWAFTPDDQIDAVRNQADFEGTAIERLERMRGQGARYFALSDKRQMSHNPLLYQYLSTHYRLLDGQGPGLIYSLEQNGS